MDKSDQIVEGNKVGKRIKIASDADQVSQVARKNEARELSITAESEPTVSFGKYKATGRFGIVALALVLIAVFLIRAFLHHTP